MIDIVVRLIAAWLAHPVHGVNVLAAKLPRANLSGPDDDAPPAVSIVNDADDKRVAADVLSVEDVPALVVWGDSHTDRQVKGYMIAKDVILGIGFVTDDSADPITTNRACGQLMRVVGISLARFNVQSIAGSARTLNNVFIDQVAHVEEQRITASNGSRKLWGFQLPHVVAVDAYSSTMLGSPQL